MPLPDPYFEPAVRDPKKLRNTALILVGIMLLGGCLILLSYRQWSKSQASDDRPAVIYRITPERDLRMLRQDGKVVNLADLRGKIVALNVTSTRDPQPSKLSMEVMKRLAEKQAAAGDVVLVTLIVDPLPADQLLKSLAAAAEAGSMKLPNWWVGGNEPKTLHKFIKNELKSSIFPNESDGKWMYDPSIVLIDKNGHIRRGVMPQKRGGAPYIAPFDFEQAAGWDAKGIKTGTELSNIQQLEVLLHDTIAKLQAEPYKK